MIGLSKNNHVWMACQSFDAPHETKRKLIETLSEKRFKNHNLETQVPGRGFERLWMRKPMTLLLTVSSDRFESRHAVAAMRHTRSGPLPLHRFRISPCTRCRHTHSPGTHSLESKIQNPHQWIQHYFLIFPRKALPLWNLLKATCPPELASKTTHQQRVA